jgi:hypothetical protein
MTNQNQLPFLRIFCTILLISSTFLSRAGTIYYFSTSGSDANNGTAKTTPKKTLGAAVSLMTAGNTILFKRGDSWYDSSLNLKNVSGTLTSPVLIDAYDSGANPVIANLKSLTDAGWTYDGAANRWKHSISGYSDALRLFVNCVSKYKVNTTNILANESNVDQPWEWYIKTGWVYANTGSSTVGPVKVEVIPTNGLSTVQMKNTNYITIRNIEFRGGSVNNVIQIDSANTNITIDNCIVRESNKGGIVVLNTSSNISAHTSNIAITNNLIDMVWTLHENDTAISFLVGDGIFLLDAVEGGLVRGNRVINFGHLGITLSSYLSANIYGVHNVVVEQNDCSAGESGYMHGFDIDGYEGLTTNNIIRRNFLHDYTSTCHVGGSNNAFYSNIFSNVRGTPMVHEDKQPYGLDIAPWQNPDTKIWMSDHDNYVVNNTIFDTDQYGMVVADKNSNNGANIEVDNIYLANNIVSKYDSSFFGQIGLNVSSTIYGNLYTKNNNVWDTSTAEKIARFKNTPPGTPNYNATELNGCPNTTPSTCGGNTEVDPLFIDQSNRDFHLTSSSTIKASGTNIYAANLYNGFVDFFGIAWNSSTPSMGAVQYGVTSAIISSGVTVTYGSNTGTVVTSPTDTHPSIVTNGNTTSSDNIAVGNVNQSVYAQIDLGALKDVSKITMYHYYTDHRTYHGVIVQLSQTADFSSYVTTVYNNDKINNAGQGYGADSEYAESASGKTLNFQPVLARYVRFWIAGNSVNGYNHFVELKVFGTAPVDKLLSSKRSVTYSGSHTDTIPSILTNGDLTSVNYVTAWNTGAVNAVADLGTSVVISKIKMWHYFTDARKYHDVIVQISNTADFSSGVTTIFNNDTDNSSGLGTGTDAEYTETSAGKTLTSGLSTATSIVTARYVRFWLNGNTVNAGNHFVELEIYGY